MHSYFVSICHGQILKRRVKNFEGLHTVLANNNKINQEYIINISRKSRIVYLKSHSCLTISNINNVKKVLLTSFNVFLQEKIIWESTKEIWDNRKLIYKYLAQIFQNQEEFVSFPYNNANKIARICLLKWIINRWSRIPSTRIC